MMNLRFDSRPNFVAFSIALATWLVASNGLADEPQAANKNTDKNPAGQTAEKTSTEPDPNKRVSIDRKEVDEMAISDLSAMPTGLFNRMTEAEILDLTAYLISGGDPKHELFRK